MKKRKRWNGSSKCSGLFSVFFSVGAAVAGNAAPAFAQSDAPVFPARVELETGAVWFTRNDVRVPGEGGTRFPLTQVLGGDASPFFRLSASYDFNYRHGIRVLYAPLQVQRTGNLDQPVRFVSTDFAADTPTEATYKFNSYRITYRYRFRNTAVSDWRVGFTLKVRDARIALRQGSLVASDSNLGLVPLLHIAGEQRFAPRWAFLLDFDGLAAPQGRAFDLGLKVGYDINPRWQVFAGYRTLEGGVDNEEVYNFTWFNYAVAGIAARF
ncbi:MAG: hypothetical protein OHK0029_07400 [Armatimonadaceae bacterium]